MDGEDSVVPVELPGEERGDLEFVELGHEHGERAGEFLVIGLLRRCVLSLHQLHHHRDLVDFLLVGDDRKHGLLQAIELGDVLLRTLVAIPEVGGAHLGVHGLDFPQLLIAVKETSIDAPSAS